MDDDVSGALTAAFEFFYYRDHSNAQIHLGAVRYSPITFRLANALSDYGAISGKVTAVLEHDGRYEHDKGR